MQPEEGMVTPFTSASEVHSMVDKDMYQFLCFDLTDAYLLIKVSEASQHLIAIYAQKASL